MLLFSCQPRRFFGVPLWVAAGCDAAGSATSAEQWEKNVIKLAESFASRGDAATKPIKGE